MSEQARERATVSLAMNVKNEEATLATTLQSVADVVDEVVILVDSTSTDRTMEIAKEYGDVVEEFVWEDSFAKARNEAIAKCTKDWVIIFDGHEILHPKSKQVLLSILSRVTTGGDLQDTGVFSAMIYMNPEDTSDIEKIIPNIFFLQPRLFKNNGKYTYVGRVHNWLATEKGYEDKKRPVNELVIIHQRTQENAESRKQQRQEMNIELLGKDIEDNPEVARPYFYLGNTHNELGHFDEALVWYEKYLGLSEWHAEKAQACLQMASIYTQREELETAKEYLYKGIAFDWERPEFLMLLGDIAFNKNNWYEAEHWYLCAKDMKPPQHGMFLHGPAYSYLPFLKLASVYSQVKEWFEAIKNGEKAQELGAKNTELVAKMVLWRRNLNVNPSRKNLIIYDETQKYSFLLDFENRMKEELNIAQGVNFDPEYSVWAQFIWMEWCSKNAIEMTHWPKSNAKQIRVIRLHSYELYFPDVIASIDFHNVDVLIFVANHIKERFIQLYGKTIPKSLRLVTISNAIEVNNWSFSKRENSTKLGIGWAGVFTEKKGVERLALVIRHFAKNHPEYKFLIRTDVPRNYSMAYFSFLQDINGLGNWEIVARQDSMDTFYEDCKYVLSTSNIEAFSYVIAEAMAKGIKPLVYDWWGAKKVWPEKLIWGDMEELDAVLTSEYKSDSYRKWVKNHFSVGKMVGQVRDLFTELSGEPLQIEGMPQEMSMDVISHAPIMDGIK